MYSLVVVLGLVGGGDVRRGVRRRRPPGDVVVRGLAARAALHAQLGHLHRDRVRRRARPRRHRVSTTDGRWLRRAALAFGHRRARSTCRGCRPCCSQVAEHRARRGRTRRRCARSFANWRRCSATSGSSSVLALGAGVGLGACCPRWRSRDCARGHRRSRCSISVPVGRSAGGSPHIEPSWATRYLAVIVGPLLARRRSRTRARRRRRHRRGRDRRALLILQPMTRLNGYPMPRGTPRATPGPSPRRSAPRLVAGDLVVVAQPEAVPLFRSQLGPGFRYADPDRAGRRSRAHGLA